MTSKYLLNDDGQCTCQRQHGTRKKARLTGRASFTHAVMSRAFVESMAENAYLSFVEKRRETTRRQEWQRLRKTDRAGSVKNMR